VIVLRADISDLAGVIPSSVKAVVGNNLDQRIVNLSSVGGSSIYEGQFDTRTLSNNFVWPVVSFRATDLLGNENHEDIEVGVDNGAPIVSLDPPIRYFQYKIKDDIMTCSRPFDPVGADAANDQDRASQLTRVRARIEDQGNNPVTVGEFVPIATVDTSRVRLFVLDDTSQPLLLDTTGDGYCDSINPALIPVGSSPQPGQAVAVNLGAVPVSGSADFSWTPPAGFPDLAWPHPECTQGSSSKPDPMCYTTALTVTTHYTTGALPSIYSIPPIKISDSVMCNGIPFDFAANNFKEGWTCVAVEAYDMLGNKGVSKPMRLYFDPVAATTGPYSGGTPAPSCTGTRLADGTVTNTPCSFRTWSMPFPQTFPKQKLPTGLTDGDEMRRLE
jgi:hypothetical protein